MEYEDNLKKVVGTRQVLRELKNNNVNVVLLAKDTDYDLIEEILQQCKDNKIDICWYKNMKKLGDACGIEVKAASAAVLKQ